MFDDRFQVFLADDPESRRLHFRLRYRIYCEERGYEEPDLFPNRLERDDADDHASHFLVRDRESGEWVAAMRLVLPGAVPFPIRSHCGLDDAGADPQVPWTRCGEISRLGVVRQQPGTRRTGPAGSTAKAGVAARNLPEVMFGLFRAAYHHCNRLGLEHCLWMSTAGMVRLLRRFDLPMRPIGESCRFRGVRHPYIIDVEAFWQGMVHATAALDPAFPHRPGYTSVAGARPAERPGARPAAAAVPVPLAMGPGPEKRASA